MKNKRQRKVSFLVENKKQKNKKKIKNNNTTKWTSKGHNRSSGTLKTQSN